MLDNAFGSDPRPLASGLSFNGLGENPGPDMGTGALGRDKPSHEMKSKFNRHAVNLPSSSLSLVVPWFAELTLLVQILV